MNLVIQFEVSFFFPLDGAAPAPCRGVEVFVLFL